MATRSASGRTSSVWCALRPRRSAREHRSLCRDCSLRLATTPRPQAHQPALEQLHLSGNSLTRVLPPPVDGAFPALRTLLLAGNRIADWSSVDALDAYPALIETRLSGNPVVEASPSTRHEVVARVCRLAMLNGSLIGRAERRDAEIRYLRRALDEVRAGGGDAAGAGVEARSS